MKRKGHIMLVTLAKLLLVSVAIVVFFGVTYKIINVFLKPASESSEAAADRTFKILSNNIENMLKSPGYVKNEVLLYLPTDNYFFVGFDSALSSVQMRAGSTDTFYKPDACIGKSGSMQGCLCYYEGEIPTDEEHKNDAYGCTHFDGYNLVFLGYFPYDITPQGDRGYTHQTRNRPETIKLFDGDVLSYEYFFLKTGDFNLAKGSRFYYLEKVTIDATTYVFITPYADEFKNRYKNFYFCSAESFTPCPLKRYDQPLTPQETQTVCGDLATAAICEYDPSSKNCEPRCVTPCEEGSITSPCLCQGTIYTDGYCVPGENGYHAQKPFDCDYVSECEDYCRDQPGWNLHYDDVAAASISSSRGCTPDGRMMCVADQCGIGCSVTSSRPMSLNSYTLYECTS